MAPRLAPVDGIRALATAALVACHANNFASAFHPAQVNHISQRQASAYELMVGRYFVCWLAPAPFARRLKPTPPSHDGTLSTVRGGAGGRLGFGRAPARGRDV